MLSAKPIIRAFFHEATNTVSYLVSDPADNAALVIDPVLDFDLRSGAVSTAAADRILQAAEKDKLRIAWILETHAHADHLSVAAYLKARTRAKIGIGERIREVQALFGARFNLSNVSGSSAEFDRLLTDGERLQIGQLTVEVLHTPGHTPACVSYRIANAVFVGDTLFMPDYGAARADFPGGDARQLYRSIRRILSLPAPGCSSAMTTSPKGARITPGKPPWVNSARGISTSTMASARTNSPRNAPHGTQRLRRRFSCCHRSRSIFALDACHRPNPTASAF